LTDPRRGEETRALDGVRVLELGQIIAGPFASGLLASFGAEVVKIEPPGKGDPLRSWRKIHEGTSLWWRVMGRNKHSVALDLRKKEGQELARRLIVEGEVDIVIENFRPGRLEAWGLGWEQIHALAPRVVMVRVSGYGQTGPLAREPGFANVAESVGGLRYLSGEPGRAPVRAGVSLGDSVAGFHAAFGALAALRHRDRTGVGQLVDVALSESVFNLLESALPEYDLLGHVRQPSGAALEGIVPTSTYPCLDGAYVVIGANSDPMFRRLMRAIDRTDLADDPRLAHNDGRVAHRDEVDQAIADWTRTMSVDDVVDRLRQAEVAAGPIQSIADIADDPQFLARHVFERVQLPGGDHVRIPAPLPKLSATPGKTEWIGPDLGAHTQEVLERWLGLGDEEVRALRERGVVG
jgi:formyl-CoA transferase